MRSTTHRGRHNLHSPLIEEHVSLGLEHLVQRHFCDVRITDVESLIRLWLGLLLQLWFRLRLLLLLLVQLSTVVLIRL